MSLARWHWLLVGVWFAVTSLAFVAVESPIARSWLLLIVFGVVPAAAWLWLFTDHQPQLARAVRRQPEGGMDVGSTERR